MERAAGSGRSRVQRADTRPRARCCLHGRPGGTMSRCPSFLTTSNRHSASPRIGFLLEPLGPQHNEDDYEAWSSSIEHIRATPGYADGRWPRPMTLEENRADLERHARDFAARSGFTYTVLDPSDRGVIGCVYIYPDTKGDTTPSSSRGCARPTPTATPRSASSSRAGSPRRGRSSGSHTPGRPRYAPAERPGFRSPRRTSPACGTVTPAARPCDDAILGRPRVGSERALRVAAVVVARSEGAGFSGSPNESSSTARRDRCPSRPRCRGTQCRSGCRGWCSAAGCRGPSSGGCRPSAPRGSASGARRPRSMIA